MAKKWHVEVVEIATNQVERSIPCTSERGAEQTERGVLRNLNHEKYFTRLTEKE